MNHKAGRHRLSMESAQQRAATTATPRRLLRLGRRAKASVGVFLNLKVVIIEGKRGRHLPSCEPRE
jgi:hypothetical protein